MTAPSFYGAPDDREYAVVERRFRELRDSAFAATPDAVLASFMEFRVLLDADIHAIKRRLFSPSLSSRDDDKAASRWISLRS